MAVVYVSSHVQFSNSNDFVNRRQVKVACCISLTIGIVRPKWTLKLVLDLLHGPLNQLLDILTNLVEIRLKSERHMTRDVE